jgi:hypothetical protein
MIATLDDWTCLEHQHRDGSFTLLRGPDQSQENYPGQASLFHEERIGPACWNFQSSPRVKSLKADVKNPKLGGD